MKSFPLVLSFGLLVFHSASAQSDAVRAAIERFENSRKNQKPNEVTVVLEPPAEPLTQPVPDPTTPEQDSPPTPVPDPSTGQEEVAPPPQVQAPAGVSATVETIQTGDGKLDPATPSVSAPFPPKPLAEAPTGWRLEPSQDSKPFRETVEIENGRNITLNIKPHLLVPETDGLLTFSIVEPGYSPEQEYQQTATVGAILSRSVQQLDEDSKQLGSALDQLEQILLALPTPAPKPVIIEDPELSSP